MEAVVAVVHHLPFRELVRHTGDPKRDFAAAFLGSPRFGDVLRAEPKVRLCLTGHSHQEADMMIGRGRAPVRVVNPGSDYDHKELVQITLKTEPGG